MENVSDLFDAFGGQAAVARVLNVGASTASEMKRRQSIPAEYWPELVSEASRRGISGVTFEWLAVIYARGRGRLPTPVSSLPAVASSVC
jgi:hypothetical protein